MIQILVENWPTLSHFQAQPSRSTKNVLEHFFVSQCSQFWRAFVVIFLLPTYVAEISCVCGEKYDRVNFKGILFWGQKGAKFMTHIFRFSFHTHKKLSHVREVWLLRSTFSATFSSAPCRGGCVSYSMLSNLWRRSHEKSVLSYE